MQQQTSQQQPVFQTSIGLGTMVMETTTTSTPSTPTTPSSPQRPSFHRRNTLVRGNGRKRCPEPPLYNKTCLRRGEQDNEEETPLSPPSRPKSVASRMISP